MRYLAIDLGAKRTGLASGDSIVKLVQPVEVIQQSRGAGLLESLARAARMYGPDALVIGLPINMDGTEGPAAREVRAFAQTLADKVKLPVHFQDERLSSFSAEELMARSGRTHKEKKELRDALAACVILKDFLA